MTSHPLVAGTSEDRPEDWHREGAAYVCTKGAFFRESSRMGRDLAILAAIAHKRTHHSLRILDAMTGSGIRPIRYALEANADFIWANEGNWELHNLLQSNLSKHLDANRYSITHEDANALFFNRHQHKDFYDLIDIDNFGSPTPTLDTSLWAIKLGGLLYLTSTDGRATSGHAPDKSLQTYSAYTRTHPAVHEQGLRLLIGAAVQRAAARGLGAQPVFAYYHGDVNRVMMRITRQSTWKTERYGFLSYCHSCGQFQTLSWKKLGKGSRCACQAQAAPVVSGPMWLGPLHNTTELAAMTEIVIEKIVDASFTEKDRWQQCQKLLQVMQSEAEQPPYHYTLADIGRRGKSDIPARTSLIMALRQQGFEATRTHINPQAIKTSATMADCVRLAQWLSS